MPTDLGHHAGGARWCGAACLHLCAAGHSRVCVTFATLRTADIGAAPSKRNHAATVMLVCRDVFSAPSCEAPATAAGCRRLPVRRDWTAVDRRRTGNQHRTPHGGRSAATCLCGIRTSRELRASRPRQLADLAQSSPPRTCCERRGDPAKPRLGRCRLGWRWTGHLPGFRDAARSAGLHAAGGDARRYKLHLHLLEGQRPFQRRLSRRGDLEPPTALVGTEARRDDRCCAFPHDPVPSHGRGGDRGCA